MTSSLGAGFSIRYPDRDAMESEDPGPGRYFLAPDAGWFSRVVAVHLSDTAGHTIVSPNGLLGSEAGLSCIDHRIDKRGQMGHQHRVEPLLHREKDTGDRREPQFIGHKMDELRYIL